MAERQTVQWIAAAIASLSLAACAAPSPGMGEDKAAGTNATQVTWNDGKPAVSITCNLPGSCLQRALAVCHNGPYKTMAFEDMPEAGSAREPSEAPSVVVRCN